MAKEKQSSKDPITKKNFDDADAVLKLTIDGSYPNAEVREIQPASKDSFQTPCSVNGLFAGMTGGSVGFLFGFGGYWLKYRLKGTLSAAMKEGWGSAKAFAVMGGIYAAVNCFMLRIRQKQDVQYQWYTASVIAAWNGAVSGCSTGLALGWSNGPLSALQSCAFLGLFSYFLDGMAGTDDAAIAATLDNNPSRPSVDQHIYTIFGLHNVAGVTQNRANIMNSTANKDGGSPCTAESQEVSRTRTDRDSSAWKRSDDGKSARWNTIPIDRAIKVGDSDVFGGTKNRRINKELQRMYDFFMISGMLVDQDKKERSMIGSVLNPAIPLVVALRSPCRSCMHALKRDVC